jgi:hypothetical protein
MLSYAEARRIIRIKGPSAGKEVQSRRSDVLWRA